MDFQRVRFALITSLLLTLLLIGPTHGSGPAQTWESALGRDHPLAGRIWDVEAGRFIDDEMLVARLTRTQFILLGEKHNNPDHHRLQAWLLSALIAADRRPAVGFEMFNTDQQEAIDRHLRTMPTDAAGLADAVGWDQTGWPKWSLYQPIAEVALTARLPIIATNLPPKTGEALRRKGLGGVDPGLVARLDLHRPLPSATHAAMAAEIHESHCGYASDAMTDAMITVQRARDAQMADRLAAAGQQDGAVLIAGVGHVRTDWGVPVSLASRLPGTTVASLAFLEVAANESEPTAYASRFGDGPLPVDYIWFTARLDDVDPCEKFSKQLKKLQKKH